MVQDEEGLLQKFGPEFVQHNAFRAVMVVEVHRVQSSCGFSIPFFEYLGERSTLKDYFAKQTEVQACAKKWVKTARTKTGGLCAVDCRIFLKMIQMVS